MIEFDHDDRSSQAQLTQRSMLSDQVRFLRHKLHTALTLSKNPMARSWVFKSPIFATLKIHRKLPSSPKYFFLRFCTQYYARIHLS